MEHKIFPNDTIDYHVHGSLIPQLYDLDSSLNIPLAHFFGVNGIGLKVVANAGAGFSWRDPDPGGLNSQTWWDLAVHDPDPQVRESSRTRVMEYNEDDVKATLAVRRWLAERPSE